MGGNNFYIQDAAVAGIALKYVDSAMGWTDWIDNVYGGAVITYELVSGYTNAVYATYAVT